MNMYSFNECQQKLTKLRQQKFVKLIINLYLNPNYVSL